MLGACMSILNRKQFINPRSVPSCISLKMARLSSTDLLRHLLSTPSIRSCQSQKGGRVGFFLGFLGFLGGALEDITCNRGCKGLKGVVGM